ncbi:YidC/Oxa1 family membrane protein insertase [Candidatus Uhrbacteria bacterium]|nr:YidC/Oxa1 family membrane protein insertase [Candidatus Uhrbacteria bacterium]
MGQLWHDYLYTPLLNALFFLYQGPAYGNLGLAVIELTVLLRVVLMPFTIVTERNRIRFERLNNKIEAIERDFKTDPVMRKEKIRSLLKQEKVNYWAKVFVLGVQALTLVLLYQVFVSGARFTRYETLYTWVSAPSAAINTMFLGFDIAAKNLIWPGIVGILLFLEIYVEQKQREHLVTRSDVMYMLFFPIFSFIALSMLPMVKSIFILTSMLFSIGVFTLRKLFFRAKPETKVPAA